VRVGECQPPEILGDVDAAVRSIRGFCGQAEREDVDLTDVGSSAGANVIQDKHPAAWRIWCPLPVLPVQRRAAEREAGHW
jgi:hypothetical protein